MTPPTMPMMTVGIGFTSSWWTIVVRPLPERRSR